jgi:hypothetical protein
MFKVLQQFLARRHRATQPPQGESRLALCVRAYQQNGLVRFWREYEAKIRASEAAQDPNRRPRFDEE